jgi:5' nucleotidase family
MDRGLISRGIVFDAWTGDLVKLGRSGRVERAYHGTRALSREEISGRYDEDGSSDYWRADGLSTLRQGRSHASFFTFVTFFDTAGIPLVAELVDAIDAGRAPPPRDRALAAVRERSATDSSGRAVYARLFPEMIGTSWGGGGGFFFVSQPMRWRRSIVPRRSCESVPGPLPIPPIDARMATLPSSAPFPPPFPVIPPSILVQRRSTTSSTTWWLCVAGAVR